MFDKPTSFHTLGLEKSGHLLKAARIAAQKGQPIVSHLIEMELNPAEDLSKILFATEQGRNLKNALNQCLVVTALESHDVLIRPLEIKLKKERDIDEVLEFQAEPLLPYPLENAVLDRIILNKGVEGTHVNILAARKDHVMEHLDGWQSLNIIPEVVTSVPNALALFSFFATGQTNPLFVINMGAEETTCAMVNGSKLLAAQASHIGLQKFQEAAKGADLASIDFSNIDKQQYPALHQTVENWKFEVTRYLFGMAKQRKEQNVENVLLTGDGASLPNLGSYVAQSLEKKLLTTDHQEYLKFAVPIGAALSGFPNWDQVNFRKQETAYPHPWRRLKKPLVSYFLLSILLATALYFFGESYLGYREDQLREEYVSLLSAMNKSYPTVEKEYAAKMHAPIDSDGVPPLKLLTADEIVQRLNFLQKSLKDSPDIFPLQPNTPRVSDVLAWLSNHPLVKKTAEDDEGRPVPAFQLENFSYTMVKRPEPKKINEQYQVKVELEFSTPTPMIAREFHDSLIAPNDIVDPKGEVKWSSNRGKYKASFFLKDKTVYPNLGGG